MSQKTTGTVLQYGDTADYGTATSWTTVARVKSLKPPMLTSDNIDTTVLESTRKEKIPGLAEVGDAEATVEYDAEQSGELEALHNVVKAWRVQYPNSGGGRKWNGWISEFGDEESQPGDIVRQSIKFACNSEFEGYEGSGS